MNLLLPVILLLFIVGFIYLIFLLTKTISARVKGIKAVRSTIDFTFSSIFLNKKLYGSVFLLGGLSICTYQLYSWLKYAEWESFSLLWPLSFSADYQDWVLYPTEWIGMHRILDFVPFSIILILIGFAFFYSFED